VEKGQILSPNVNNAESILYPSNATIQITEEKNIILAVIRFNLMAFLYLYKYTPASQTGNRSNNL
jgi:hypothetical protein